jgi:tetratricopeptide (TPR) repeat protein
MKRRGFSACLISLMIAGCASVPSQGPGMRGYLSWGTFTAYDRLHQQAPVTPSVTNALNAIHKGSPESLQAAARMLAVPDIAGILSARDLAGVGRELFGLMYPDLPTNPFPSDARSSIYGELFAAVRNKTVKAPSPTDTDFFLLVFPGLLLLDPSTRIDAPTMDGLEAGLTHADEVSRKTSVLPPYLLALLKVRRAVSTGGSPDVSTMTAALSLFQESQRRDPSFYLGQRKAADILISQNKSADALAFVTTESRNFPDDPSLSKKLAQVALEGGNPQAALDASAKAMMANPTDSEIFMIRARAYEQTGNWSQAIRVLDTLLLQFPNSSPALLMKARLLADNADQPEDAIQMLIDDELRFPKDPSFPELKGRILLDEGRGDEGLKALNHALELQPDRISTLKLLMKDAVKLKQWMQANAYLARVPEASRTGDDQLIGYQISWNLGDYKQAATFARKMLSANYGQAPHLLLARAFHAQGNDAAARPLIDAGFQAAKDSGVKSELYRLRAEIVRQTAPEEALKDLRSALFENPDNVDALIAISDMLSTARQYRAALGYLKHAADLSPDNAGLRVQIQTLDAQATAAQ